MGQSAHNTIVGSDSHPNRNSKGTRLSGKEDTVRPKITKMGKKKKKKKKKRKQKKQQ